jgi:hypothetical protein
MTKLATRSGGHVRRRAAAGSLQIKGRPRPQKKKEDEKSTRGEAWAWQVEWMGAGIGKVRKSGTGEKKLVSDQGRGDIAKMYCRVNGNDKEMKLNEKSTKVQLDRHSLHEKETTRPRMNINPSPFWQGTTARCDDAAQTRSGP